MKSNRYTHQEPGRNFQRPARTIRRQRRIEDNIRDGRTVADMSDQKTKHDQEAELGGTRWTDTDIPQGIIGSVPTQISVVKNRHADRSTTVRAT